MYQDGTNPVEVAARERYLKDYGYLMYSAMSSDEVMMRLFKGSRIISADDNKEQQADYHVANIDTIAMNLAIYMEYGQEEKTDAFTEYRYVSELTAKQVALYVVSNDETLMSWFDRPQSKVMYEEGILKRLEWVADTKVIFLQRCIVPNDLNTPLM